MQLTKVRLDTLILDPMNAREHGARNLETIGASFGEFGQVENIVVQKSSNRVISGNGRVQVLLDAKVTEVFANIIDCNDSQATKLGLAMNRTAELGTWDKDRLKEISAWLAELNVPIDDIGFSPDELMGMGVSDFKFESLDPEETSGDMPSEKRVVQCPNCGENFSP